MTTMLIEWVVTSVFLILTVLALRAVFGKRVSARMRYALWAVVLVRLLVPVQLFTSPLAGTRVFTEKRTEQHITDPSYLWKADPLDVPPANPTISVPEGAVTPLSPPRVPDAPEPPAAPDLTRAPGVLGWTWLGGSAVMALVLAASNLRFARRLRRCRIPVEGADCPLRVYAAVGLPSPCLFGLARPGVYVTPEAAADPVMLRHVVAHEYTHFRHGDHIWSFLRCAALAAHWWNPLVWLAVALSRRDGELACDEGALRRLGDGERLAYGNTLLALVTAKPRPGELLCFATTMAGDKKSLKERVSRIARAPKRVLWAALAVVLVTALACACAFGQAAGETDDPAPDPTPSETPAASQDVEVEIAFSNAVPADVLNAAKAYVAQQFQTDVPDGWVKEWGSSYDEEKGDWVPVPLRDPVEFDRVRIKNMTDAGSEMMELNGETVEVKLWHFTCEYHTTMPEKAQILLAGGMYLDEDGWMNFCGCNYLAVTTGTDGTKVTPFMVQADRKSVGFRNDLLNALQEAGLESGQRYKNADTLYNNDGSFRTTDLNRNGVAEYIQTCDIFVDDGVVGRRMEVWEDGGLIFSEEAYHAHAGYNAVFLCTLDGEDYLLRYNPYTAQGGASYTYQLFTLSENGEEQAVRENSMEFYISLISPTAWNEPFIDSFNPEKIAAFMDEINGLLANSVQLINTDDQLLDTFRKEGRLYDSLWWLNIDFTRDPSKSLLENLRDYQASMERAVEYRYWMTLMGRTNFILREASWDDGAVNERIANIADIPAVFYPDDPYMKLWNFAIVDMDGDGTNEVVVYGCGVSGDTTGYLVLYQIDGNLYGVAFNVHVWAKYWFEFLKTDGTFMRSDPTGTSWTRISRLEFNAAGYTIDDLAVVHHVDWEELDSFEVNHRTATKAEFEAVRAAQDAKPDAVWYEFNEENINIVFRS